MIDRAERGKRKAKRIRKRKFHIGFTNLLALLIMALLCAGLLGGFYLAMKSIEYQYMGALACYTAVFAPIGTAASIVLNSIVHKSDHENTGPNGEGIKYAAAEAAGFIENDFEESPQI